VVDVIDDAFAGWADDRAAWDKALRGEFLALLALLATASAAALLIGSRALRVAGVLAAAGARLAPETIEIGEKVYKRGVTAGIEPSAWESLRRTRLFLKAPITTPQGGGYKSLNVTTRKAFGLYANVRPCVSYHPFVATKHPVMDVVIVRENEEDLYASFESGGQSGTLFEHCERAAEVMRPVIAQGRAVDLQALVIFSGHGHCGLGLEKQEADGERKLAIGENCARRCARIAHEQEPLLIALSPLAHLPKISRICGDARETGAHHMAYFSSGFFSSFLAYSSTTRIFFTSGMCLSTLPMNSVLPTMKLMSLASSLWGRLK